MMSIEEKSNHYTRPPKVRQAYQYSSRVVSNSPELDKMRDHARAVNELGYDLLVTVDEDSNLCVTYRERL